MEIKAMRERLGRQLWPIAVIPLLAAAGGAAYAAQQPPSYSAQASALVAPPGGSVAAASVNQVQSSMVSLATSADVAAEVAKSTDVPVGRVQDSVSASRGDASDTVLLTVTDTDRAVAEKIATAVPKALLDRVYAPSVAQASFDVDLAQDEYESATKALAEARSKAKVAYPDKEYAARVQEVSSLRVALANARSRPADVLAGPIEEALASAVKARDAMLKAQLALEGPFFDVEQARDALTDRRTTLAEIKGRLKNAESQTVLTPASEQSETLNIIRMAVTAGVVGLGAAGLVALLVGLVRRALSSSEDEIVEEEAARSRRRRGA